MKRLECKRAVTSTILCSIVVAALSLGGCRSTLPIGELLDDASRYEGKTVRIEGEVTESVGALGTGAYRVTDDTGTILVVSQEGGVPRTGARVRVDGWFQSALTFGERSIAGLMERGRSVRR